MNPTVAALALALTSPLFGSPASPGSPGPPGPAPTGATERTVDHLDLELRVDPAADRVDAVARYTIATRGPLESLGFYLSKELEVSEVTGERIASHTLGAGDSFLDAAGNRLALTLTDGAADGDEPAEIQFTVRYAGRASSALANGWLEVYVDRMWFPVHESLRRKLTAEIRIALPEDYEVFARGAVDRTADGWRITHTTPISDLNFIASPGLEVENFRDGAELVRVAGKNLSSGPAQEIATEIQELLRWYNGTFGAAAPEHELALVLRPEDGGLPGYARPGYIVLHVSDDFDEGRTEYLQFFAHEVSHLWWSKGSPVGFENWLNESFAEYSSMLAARAMGHEEYFANLVARKRAKSRGMPPVIGVERTDPNAHTVFYTKGCLILHELEERVGAKSFVEWLGLLVERDVRSTDELLIALDEHAGAETAAWLEGKLLE